MNKLVRQVALVATTICAGAAAAPRAPESIVANDNRRAAGTLKNGVLTLKLEARSGLWRPEGDQGRALPVAAWAEEGKPMSVPGPLIRVPVGTDVKASLHNSLDRPLIVFGFGKPRGMTDSVVIPAGAHARRAVQGDGARHLLLHGARQADAAVRRSVPRADMELVGAIVVDPPGAPRRMIASSCSRGGSRSTRRARRASVARRWRSTDSHGRTPSGSISRRATPCTGA